MRIGALLVTFAALHVRHIAVAGSGGIYSIEADDLRSGLPVPLSFYRGKVMLIVNVASQCGYTEQTYKWLNQLHAKYAAQGLSILAFPCNQFGEQEPGTSDQIYSFAMKAKGVQFDLFRKVDVQGRNAHPVFKWLLGEDGSTDCTDSDTNCQAWADAGECDANPDFMQSSCRRSCKHCSAPATLSPPIRWNFESFLVDRRGNLHTRWPTGVDLVAPGQTSVIEALLAQKEEL
jgi:glutathione peroxidase